MDDRLVAGGPMLIGFHRLLPAGDGLKVPELTGPVSARAGRSAEIIPFPQILRSGAVRPLLFCEICRFPAILRPAASVAGR